MSAARARGYRTSDQMEPKCKSLTPRNAMDKVLANIQGFADEAHREASSERVHETHARLHKAGHVVGGRVFGYRNRVVFNGEDRDGNPLRSHVEREIDPSEAAVVRRIFTLYDSGLGLKRIANAPVRVLPSMHYQRTDGLQKIVGWAPSTVRCVLTRETYRGMVVWNKTKKKNDWGQWDPTDRPESEWIRTQAEHLRIIDQALWTRVAARRADTEGHAIRFGSGRLSGRHRRMRLSISSRGWPRASYAVAG